MSPGGRAVKILFVDDVEDNLSVLKPRMVREFSKLGCEIEFEFERDADIACDRISGRAPDDAYPVVMADLLFPVVSDSNEVDGLMEPRGLEVVEEARSASADSVIVALTGGNKHQPDLESRAAEKGADIVLRRYQLLATARQGGIAELVRKIHAQLCERDLISFGPSLEVPEEPGIQSVVHDTGHATLRLLLADIFAGQQLEPVRVALSYISPGASGAQVMRAAATLADGSRRQLLIKVSQNPKELHKEQQNYKRSAGLYDPSLIVPYLDTVGPRNTWSALGVLYAPDVMTLRRWITDPGAAAAVPAVFDRLFLQGGLSAGYRNLITAGCDEKPITKLSLPPFRRILVRAAADQLLPALTHSSSGVHEDAEAVLDIVAGFARDGRLGNVQASETPPELLLCIGHGDLHGGNILVSAVHPAPVVIDIANFGRHHWASDVSRLCVDLVMCGLDAGVESYFWRRFGNWRMAARMVGDLDPSITDDLPGNGAAIAALRWIASHRLDVLPPLSDPMRMWEWRVAVGEQFLRRTYDKEMSPAKRTLGLVAAYDQILAAAEVVPRAKRLF